MKESLLKNWEVLLCEDVETTPTSKVATPTQYNMICVRLLLCAGSKADQERHSHITKRRGLEMDATNTECQRQATGRPF